MTEKKENSLSKSSVNFLDYVRKMHNLRDINEAINHLKKIYKKYYDEYYDD